MRLALVASWFALLLACGAPSQQPSGSPDAAAAAAVAPGAAAVGAHLIAHGLGHEVTVMTRNLYLGADINKIATAQTPQEIPAVVGALWATVQMTDFPARARLLATEIERAGPDLVALQEAALFRTGPGATCLGLDVPATTVAIDFLALLQAELAARGQHYELASTVANFDRTLCAFDGQGFLDVRLTDRDAVLVRRGVVQVERARSGNFTAAALFPAGGGVIPVARGWNVVDVRVRGRPLRLVATHLEQESAAAVQEAQAAELALLARAEARGPVLLSGDFNAGPGLASVTSSYADLLAAGFRDPWPRLRPFNAGPTCCFDELLLTGALSQRIDLNLWSGRARPLLTWRTGLDDRTAAGLHASDHAGVVTVFRLRDEGQD